MTPDFSIQSQADSLTLFGRHWPAKNPAAVMSLVHGFGEHSGRYEHMAKYLNSAGISVVAIDLRGHGRTEGPRGVCRHYSDMSADVDTLLAQTKTLYPDLPHYLFGHSMGGGLVLHHGMAQESRHQLDGYLVSAPLIRPKDPVPKALLGLANILRRVLPNGGLPNPISGEKISTLPSEQAIYASDGLNHGRLGFGLAVGMIGAGKDVLAKAKNWDKPLCLWHSKEDKLTDFSASEAFSQAAQKCEFTAFEDAEHEMHNDTSREAVYALMLKFMDPKTT